MPDVSKVTLRERFARLLSANDVVDVFDTRTFAMDEMEDTE